MSWEEVRLPLVSWPPIIAELTRSLRSSCFHHQSQCRPVQWDTNFPHVLNVFVQRTFHFFAAIEAQLSREPPPQAEAEHSCTRPILQHQNFGLVAFSLADTVCKPSLLHPFMKCTPLKFTVVSHVNTPHVHFTSYFPVILSLTNPSNLSSTWPISL